MFWKEKKLNEMSPQEWELLCDRCGKCCTLKLQDEETQQLYDTSIVCKLYNIKKCKCSKYQERHKYVSDCIKLTYENIESLSWLPDTCAYRLLDEERELYSWHHLISGSYSTVHDTQNSISSDNIFSENDIEENDYEDYITNKIKTK
tara:strand:- start:12955 stop:13395 length:441 start_codon:yes stop_codon:yes gene_type:complete